MLRAFSVLIFQLSKYNKSNVITPINESVTVHFWQIHSIEADRLSNKARNRGWDLLKSVRGSIQTASEQKTILTKISFDGFMIVHSTIFRGFNK